MYTQLGTIIPSVSGCVRIEYIEYNIENVTNLSASSGLNVPLLLVSGESSHLTAPGASHLYLQLSHWSLWPDSS
jgi:hypothetical protein